MPPTLTALILQSRDRKILASLAEHSVMDTDMIHAHYFPDVSQRRCRQRLSLYQAHGLTRTANLKLWTKETSRRIPTVHSLTDHGVEIVRSLDETCPIRVSRGEPSPATIHHRLQIVWTKLTLDAAFRNLNLQPPEWILEQDRDHAASIELPPNQRRLLYHSFTNPHSTCQPDAACRFTIPRDLSNPNTNLTDVVGLFEIDMSSEGRKQILKKLPGYTRLLADRTHHRYFPGTDNPKTIVRIFWICRSEERIRSLREQCANEPTAQFFRLTTSAELTPQTALTTPIWQDLTGKRREILRLPKGNQP